MTVLSRSIMKNCILGTKSDTRGITPMSDTGGFGSPEKSDTRGITPMSDTGGFGSPEKSDTRGITFISGSRTPLNVFPFPSAPQGLNSLYGMRAAFYFPLSFFSCL